MSFVFIGAFLIVEGLTRLGVNFQGSELVKGLLLLLAGIFMVVEYL